jgi:hypothetical protein
MPSSGVWRRVDMVDWTDVSDDRIASIFRVEKSASEEPAWAGTCRICLCWLQSKNFSWQHWMFFFHLPTLCSARVSALVIVLSDSPCERIRKWETWQILREDRSWCAFAGESLIKPPHYYVYRERQFLRLFRHTWIMGRQHQRRGTVGEINIDRKRSSYIEKDCFEKSHELLQHR